MKKIFDKVLKTLSAILLLGGTIVGFLATRYMGVQRSLYFRNSQLQDFLLDTTGLLGLGLLGGFYYWLIKKDVDRLTSVQLSVFRVAAWIFSVNSASVHDDIIHGCSVDYVRRICVLYRSMC